MSTSSPLHFFLVPLLFDLCPGSAHLRHLGFVGLQAAITSGSIHPGDNLQARLRERRLCVEALPELVGRLVFLAWIAAISRSPQQQAIDFTNAVRGLPSCNRLRCSLCTSRRSFTGKETPKQPTQERFELCPE